jgi:hypothetical protein
MRSGASLTEDYRADPGVDPAKAVRTAMRTTGLESEWRT